MIKRICSIGVAVAVVCLMLFGMAGCSSSNPCQNCGRKPTKGYRNEMTDEKEYYCDYCTTECVNCGRFADNHYTMALTYGSVMKFVCDDCYTSAENLGFVFKK